MSFLARRLLVSALTPPAPPTRVVDDLGGSTALRLLFGDPPPSPPVTGFVDFVATELPPSLPIGGEPRDIGPKRLLSWGLIAGALTRAQGRPNLQP